MLHTAYSFALAFRARVVRDAMERLSLGSKSMLLDPFCGTGTTLLECKLQGVRSCGVDANPVCVVVSRAKTNWSLNVERTRETTERIIASSFREYESYCVRAAKTRTHSKRWLLQAEPIFARSGPGRYLLSSGLIHRGWIGVRPALKTLLIAERVWKLPYRERDFLLMGLLGLLVPDISNMAYGPEIYRARRRTDRDVFGLFRRRVNRNLENLEDLKSRDTQTPARALLGDSANGGLRFLEQRKVDAILTSPPYLSDHDYSRLTRLELVFSGQLTSPNDLRRLKRRMLRSSSKNVYKDDHATALVSRYGAVKSVIRKIRKRAEGQHSGFARVYPRLIGEYFGDMYKHFQAIGRVLKPGGQAAYIVADQSSFFALKIETAAILAHLAESCGAGLRLRTKEPLKKYHGTRGAVTWSNQEWVLVLEKTGRRVR